LKEDGLGLKYNDALKSQIPAEALDAVVKAINDIKSGAIEVPFIPE
jgi:basic membrane lipoprotein Med (substrate-binding protein (PBP1-ABC) superfamily)